MTESAADSLIGSNWLGCAENLRPLNETQELMSKHAVAFFKTYLGGDDEYESVLLPNVDQLSGKLMISPRVSGARIRDGLDFLVTDPVGRRLGVEPSSEERVNDFGDKARNFQQGASNQRFEIEASEILSGNYAFEGKVASSLNESRELELTFSYESQWNDDFVGISRRVEVSTVSGGSAFDRIEFTVLPPDDVFLMAGDADQDFDFDQLDLVQVQVAAKYLSGEAATWGEGDWNGAPGGSVGSPPAGDGLFNQFDVVAAQQAGTYLTGPYAVVRGNGKPDDGQTYLVYNPISGELAVDAPAGVELTSINIDSAAGMFTGNAAENLGGSFDNDADGNIFKATFGASFGSVSFGNVAQTGLSEEFVLGDLTVVGSLAGGGDLGAVDLVYLPEPMSAVLLGVGVLNGLLLHFRGPRR